MKPPEPSAPLVEVRGLGKAFAGRSVIEGVSLRLGAGDIVGLVGANGGGKTTTLRMIAGLLAPDAGEGTVLGHDVRRPGPGLRARVGYMGQRLSLYPDLSVADNLLFRARAHRLARPADAVAAAARGFGLSAVLPTRFERLSGGWARRVQFAATLMHAPPLLLLDEPTAGLDVATRRDIWRWLGELAGGGTAIIVSTHDLAEAERCPAILYYEGGQVEGPFAPAALAAATGAATLEAAVIARADAAGRPT